MKTIKIKFRFNLLSGMVLQTLVLHTKILFREELDRLRKKEDHNIIEGEIEFETSASECVFSFTGSGDITTINTEGTYNFIYKNKNVYTEDKSFKVNDFGRFGDVLTKVKL